MATQSGFPEALGSSKPVSPLRKVIFDDEGFAELTLNDNGLIRECSRSVERLFGYTPASLMWQHVSLLLPQLAGVVLVHGGEINHRLHFLAHIGHCFEMVSASGVHSPVRICLSDHESSGRHYVRITVRLATGEELPH